VALENLAKEVRVVLGGFIQTAEFTLCGPWNGDLVNRRVTRSALVVSGVSAATLVAFVAAAECNGSRVYAPAPLITVVPAIYIQQGLAVLARKASEVSLVACVGFVYAVAALGHLLWGGERVPNPSVWVFGLLAVADLAFFMWEFRFGQQYQGVAYTLSLAAINIGLVLAIAATLRRNRLRPSFASNFGFHVTLVLWLCWFSFPWLGEMP
jgi:hypothetical protein